MLTPDQILRRKADAFDEICEILWPGGDMQHDWDHDTLDAVGDAANDAVEEINAVEE